jgi:Rho GTPase-activating protein 1
LPIEDLLIPPSAYLYDRRLSPDIHAPYATGRRAFGVKHPLPKNKTGGTRLPRILRETTNFILLEPNIKTEGLFRIPAHQRLKEILRESYDRGQKFIVWKDNDVMLPVLHYPEAENVQQVIEEVDPKDAYNVHLATGLLKFWYSCLRDPIVPQHSYQEFWKHYSDVDHSFSIDEMKEIFSPAHSWSPLPQVSREILTRHLLPLLDVVSAQCEANKMTAENLAVCFAPAMVCGPDQIEDAKMSSLLRRLLTAAISDWSRGLREACQIDPSAFKRDLLPPTDPQDFEDPPEHTQRNDEFPTATRDMQTQFSGIVMMDNEDDDEKAPPLPPRAPVSSAPKRKPAPPLAQTPRYSSIIADSPVEITSPLNAYTIADGSTNISTTRDVVSTEQSEEGNARESFMSNENDQILGTELTGAVPSIILPKRKALTTEQIVRAKQNLGSVPTLSSGNATQNDPKHIAKTSNSENVKRKPIQASSEYTTGSLRTSSIPGILSGDKVGTTTQPGHQSSSGRSSDKNESEDSVFRKPTHPASANRSFPTGSGPNSAIGGYTYREPIINSLAKPVRVPESNSPGLFKSSTLPAPISTKPRKPSPSLLKRMPSFEPKQEESPSDEPQHLGPRKLDLRKTSVDDLRRLYEERAGAAQTLVELGKITYTDKHQ